MDTLHGTSVVQAQDNGSLRSMTMAKRDMTDATETVTETPTTTTTVLEFPDIADERRSGSRDPNTPSIRRICREGLLAGKSTASITAVIKQFHPDSAAAVKSSKHIGYYRAQLKAEGKLAKS